MLRDLQKDILKAQKPYEDALSCVRDLGSKILTIPLI